MTGTSGVSPTVRRVVLGLGIAVLVAGIGYQVHRLQQPPRGSDPGNDVPALAAVRTYDYVGGDHTSDPVAYAQTPPAGGPHDPVWEDCGSYPSPVRDENAVHSLEHGTVWVTYDPALPAADVETLAGALRTVKSGKTILSPYPDLPAPVVVTVWNAQLRLTGADDPRLATFLGFYGDGHTAPETRASCAGGVHNLAPTS